MFGGNGMGDIDFYKTLSKSNEILPVGNWGKCKHGSKPAPKLKMN